MHTLSVFNLQTPIASRFSALRSALAAGLRRWRHRAQARRMAQAFERLDDRTLRDLGFHRADAGAFGAAHHRLCHHTLCRVIQAM